ncbi:MAG: hypothetical protein ABI227_06715 [Rhodanobacter sp.]
MQRGTYAVSMQPINPTVTWPNPVAMVNGVNASLHPRCASSRLGSQHRSPMLQSQA